MFRKKEEVVEIIDNLDRYLPESFLEKELYSEEGLNFLRDSILELHSLCEGMSKVNRDSLIQVLRMNGEEAIVSIMSYLYIRGDKTFSAFDEEYFNNLRSGELSLERETQRALVTRIEGLSFKEKEYQKRVFRMLAEKFDKKPEACLKMLRVFQATPTGFCYFIIKKG